MSPSPQYLNHPTQEITVSTWFYVDRLEPQTLVSAYKDGDTSRDLTMATTCTGR